MSSARIWLRQAKSDMLTARYLAQQESDDFYCQTVAKCQQVVEKSIKAIAAELTERRIVTLTIGFDHRVDQYISAIIRTPRNVTEKRSVPGHISQSLRNNRNAINEIMRLAPHRTGDVQRLPRNTEYPFHNSQGVLIAPADTGVFEKSEVETHLRVAGTVFSQAQTLITISERAPN